MAEYLEDKTEKKEKSMFRGFFRGFKFAAIVVLVLVVMAGIGGWKYYRYHFEEKKWENAEVVPSLDYDLDAEVLAALENAHKVAYDFASEELDEWIGTLNERSAIFIDDYFTFANVKGRELKSFFVSKEKMKEELDIEISKRVIKPDLSQQTVENIMNGAVDRYLSTLDKELASIRIKHKIPVPEWNKYICRLCSLTHDMEMKRYPLAIKAAVVGGISFVAIPVTSAFVSGAEKMLAKQGAKAAVKGGAKTGIKILSNGARFIPLISVAIIGWDVYDYSKTAKKGREELRGNFDEYFKQVKVELMGNTDKSIMGAITDWENGIKAKIADK